MNDLDRLVALSQRIGRSVPLWTQGAGGNFSVKLGDEVWVKKTGVRLDGVRSRAELACLSRAAFLAGWSRVQDSGDERGYSELIGEVQRGSVRPSMEAGFHALLDAKWVGHFHSLPAILMDYELATSRERFETWWSDQRAALSFKSVPLEMPGLRLAGAVGQSGSEAVIFLRSHGVILCSDEPWFEDERSAGVLAEWSRLEKNFCRDFGYSMLHSLCEGATPAWQELEPARFRVTMPDVAVFQGQIRACLEPVGQDRFKLRSAVDARDRSFVELWQAMLLLEASCPSLPELPLEMRGTIRDLPTEKLRQK